MTDELGIDIAEGARLLLSGELTQANVARLREALAAAELAEVDLAGLRFMDSAGLGVLLAALEARPNLRLVAPSVHVQRIFEMSGLESFFDAE